MAARADDPAVRLDATFASSPVPGGAIGLVTQSGGVGIALREQLGLLGRGLSVTVPTGGKYDVSGQRSAEVVVARRRHRRGRLYLESFGNPRKFGRLARALARALTRTKPVLPVRTGSTVAA